MQTLPIQASPWQEFNTTLAGQNCRIAIYQRSTGLYVNLSINDALLLGGAPAQNRNLIVRDAYIGFIGDLVILDTQGGDDPTYDGLGGRFQLLYLAPDEVVTALDKGYVT